MTIMTDDKILTNLDDQKKNIEMCILFDSLFSISRTSCGEIDHKKINDLKEVISLCLRKWRNLRLSMKMIKIYGVEDHLFEQIEKFNKIGCFIEDFIERMHQFGMLDEKRTGKIRDRKSFRTSFNK